jgi:exonuclease SbcC
MHIHSLEITGFGPFKNTQIIDFDALTADRLFMLEGPTGAGKSSIIDAIVWVLYGNTAHQAARKAADDKTGGIEFGARVHSDFLDPGDETKVKIEFSVNSARYRVQRTQSFLPKKKGSEELVSKSTSRLEFIRPTAEAITKDIHVEIYRILQMEVAQFSQLVVLPQAAFDTFLRAKSESRGDVLEKVFRTYFYSEVEKHLNNRGREIESALEAKKISMDHHIRNLHALAIDVPDLEIEVEDEIEFFRRAEDLASRVDKDSKIIEIVTALEPNTAIDDAKKTELDSKLLPLVAKITKLEDSLLKIIEKAKKTARLKELNDEKNLIDELEKQLKAIQKASTLRVLRDAVNDAQAKIDAIDEVDEDLEEWSSQEIKDRLKELAPLVKELAKQVAQSEGLEQKITDLSDQLENAEFAAEAIKEIPKLERSLAAFVVKIGAQKKKNAAYEGKKVQSWVHDAAKGLKKGQSCPVCGSKDHPAPIKGASSFNQKTYDAMLADLEELQGQEQTIRDNIGQYKHYLRSKTKTVAAIKKEIASLEKKKDSASVTKKAHKELEDEQQNLENNREAIIALESATSSLEKAEQKFGVALKKAGIEAEDLEELLDLDEEKIQKRITGYRDEVVAITAVLAEYKGLPAEDQLESQIETLTAQKIQIETELLSINHQISLSEDRRKRIHAAQEGITGALDAMDAILSKEGSIMKLSKLANGYNPDALRLTNFVLQERLEMILERSSLHLLKISNGKFEFKLNEEKGSSRKNAGLGITVIDHVAGRERPAEALSGGETFYASLSLCLGLAEVVKMDKGGIELGTLFIDEGFGSLSNDKLTEVLDVLDKLRENGRIIGIITHLEDMKSQIPLRLEVIRTDVGPSTVRMAVGGIN